jgi:hypothetical protein
VYIYRGGQLVEEGIYWEPEKNERIMMKAGGFLPGTDDKAYFRVPECYVLIPVLLFGLVLSIVLPYGLGLAVFVCLYLIHNVLFSASSVFEELFREVGAHISVAYKPYLSFFSGSHRKIKASGKKEITKDEKRSSCDSSRNE